MDSLKHPILCINGGSSSIKACLFDTDGQRHTLQYRFEGKPTEVSYRQAFDKLGQDLKGKIPGLTAHRFVHGGDVPESAREITPQERERLNSIVHLAPLHLPMNILGVELCTEKFPSRQIACFDTAFHHNLPAISRVLPIPQKENMRRYGFHGLSYAYLSSKLEALIGEKARGRIIIAHLGSGSSLCMINNLESIDTTMGYTPAGGVCMGTRPGDLDPGIMLELMQRYDAKALSKLVNEEMGLVALSNGLSGNMEVLLASQKPEAKFAVDYFCSEITSAIGSMAAKAGGVEGIVFSGGIGENSSLIRSKICAPLAFLGVQLDLTANDLNNQQLAPDSNITVLCLKTDEESIMKDLAKLL